MLRDPRCVWDCGTRRRRWRGPGAPDACESPLPPLTGRLEDEMVDSSGSTGNCFRITETSRRMKSCCSWPGVDLELGPGLTRGRPGLKVRQGKKSNVLQVHCLGSWGTQVKNYMVVEISRHTPVNASGNLYQRMRFKGKAYCRWRGRDGRLVSPSVALGHQQPSIDRDRDDPEPCSVQTGPNGRRVRTHASRYMVLEVERLDLGWRVAVVLRGQGGEGGASPRRTPIIISQLHRSLCQIPHSHEQEGPNPSFDLQLEGGGG